MPAWIRVAPDRHTFALEGTNETFIPLGCNYFDPTEDWPFQLWKKYDHDRYARQLAQIAGAGFNCIRVFLETGFLNPAEGVYSEEGFAKVDDFVALAAANGLRIIFSGPNFNEGVPPHRHGDVYGDPRQLELCCDLWRKLGERYGQNPTIMTWDLYNEPMVHWYRPDHRHAGPRAARWRAFAGEHLSRQYAASAELLNSAVDGYDRRLYLTYLRFLEDLGENWVAAQCRTIRETGARQLISVGLIQWSTPIMLPAKLGYGAINPRRVAKHLDYMSQHFYPILTAIKESLDDQFEMQKTYLQVIARAAYIPGKPLVMEEFGWKGGRAIPGDPVAFPEEHQTRWCETLVEVTRQVACGWLNWAYADSPAPTADVSAATGLWTSDGCRLKHWGQRFARYAEDFRKSPPRYVPPKKTYEINLGDYLYDHGGHPGYDWLWSHAEEGAAGSLAVNFADIPL